jgi:predicted ribosome quality control (RQC) complex YloA/Tae2 family protein
MSLDGAKKVAIEKGKKTLEASVRQLEIAEKKILASLEKKEANVPTITRYRPPYWFEKFLWFISSGMII